jgi:hypothetical protein
VIMRRKKTMTVDERRNYLRQLHDRYLEASKSGKGRLLDDMEATTGLHRKSLIRLLAGNLERIPRRKKG